MLPEMGVTHMSVMEVLTLLLVVINTIGVIKNVKKYPPCLSITGGYFKNQRMGVTVIRCTLFLYYISKIEICQAFSQKSKC